MQIADFRSIVSAFADPGSEILFEKATVLVSVNGDVIQASLSTQSGDVYVDEGSGQEPASKWILNRLAKLPLLATRLRDTVAATDFFVSPEASLLPTLMTGPNDSAVPTSDALETMLKSIGDRSPLETTVLYVTSNAGEGKTTLINQAAREQAKRFSEHASDWLLVPIPLGGRHFLRFDDITVGVLQNRYRFPFLYYNSFLALVKMGVLVPAFDGFEEMFVENSSGEALSAMGILVGSLDSKGAIVVAARKAYFEFENLKSQERLFETIRKYSVGFGKLELARWGEAQFLTYCANREIDDARELYRRVSERISPSHPLLTRAVLVRRLVDVAEKSQSLDKLLEQIQVSGADFFSVFVRSIIEREANEKWIDRSGENEIGTPLLSVEEHCGLLAQVALAMWEARVDHLKLDHMEFVADYFCEVHKKSGFQAQQVRERLRGHAMLVPSGNPASVEFDHDEFRLFFLGEGVASQIRPSESTSRAEVLGSFRKGVLPQQAQAACVLAVNRSANLDRLQVARFILEVSAMDAQASYTQENCSGIILDLLSGVDAAGIEISRFVFGSGALAGRKISGVLFRDCYWAPTSLEGSELSRCIFANCAFPQLRIYPSTSIEDVTLDHCSVDALVLADPVREVWDPAEIRRLLSLRGLSFVDAPAGEVAREHVEATVDAGCRDMEKLIRYMMRSTHMSESVLKMKLGSRGALFIDDSLPKLIRRGVMVEIDNRGGGPQRRFGLGMSLQKLNSALVAAGGSFERFLEQFEIAG